MATSVDYLQNMLLVYYPRESNYQNNETRALRVEFTNIKDLLARFFLEVHYRQGEVDNWRNYCLGLTSLDGVAVLPNRGPVLGHLPMFDYDGKNIKSLIRRDVRKLQEDFGLGPAEVFHTQRGFHVLFGCDNVPWEQYRDMLEITNCCEGFKKETLKRKRGTLRFSAKYTTFDIYLSHTLVPPRKGGLWRKRPLMRLREALIRLGQESNTHLASIFPQWANYKEDEKIWRPKKKVPNAPYKKLRIPELTEFPKPKLTVAQEQLLPDVPEEPKIQSALNNEIWHYVTPPQSKLGLNQLQYSVEYTTNYPQFIEPKFVGFYPTNSSQLIEPKFVELKPYSNLPNTQATKPNLEVDDNQAKNETSAKLQENREELKLLWQQELLKIKEEF